METFRLIHLSDLHFSDSYLSWYNDISSTRIILKNLFKGKNVLYPSTFDKDIALAVADHISGELDTTDAVLVTGDLATTGGIADLNTARNYFLGNVPPAWRGVSSLRYKLMDGDSSFVMVPGNHDRYQSLPSYLPGSTNYEEVFGVDWSLCSIQKSLRVHEIADRVRFVHLNKDGEHLIVLCADLALRDKNDADSGFMLHMGQGKAYQDTIDDLVDLTRLIWLWKETPIIWVVHFPPSNPSASDEQAQQYKKLRLIDDQVLSQAASLCSIPLMLCGHVHDQHTFMLEGEGQSTMVFCAGTACSVDAGGNGNKFLDLEIDVDNGQIKRLVARDIVYDEDAGCFLSTASENRYI